MGLPMSPSYSHTLSGALPDDEDDGDICPVCDGECTCNTTKLPLRPPTPAPPSAAPKGPGPLSMEELSRQYNGATSPSTPSLPPSRPPQPKKQQPPPPSYPSLKIKLAIPPNLLAKRQAAPESSGSSSSHRKSRNPDEMTFADARAGENFAYIGPSSGGAATPTPSSYRPQPSTSAQPSTAPRKRGRPRKIIPHARDLSPDSRRDSTSPVHHKRPNPKTNIIGRQRQIYAQKYAKTLKARAPPPPPAPKALKKKKAPPPKRRRRIDSDSSLSELSDDDDFGGHSRAYDPDSEGDAESIQFPTFVSASALSSMESGADGNSSDSSLSDFTSDDSLEKEEEEFLRAEMGDKSRRNEWVIRNRRKSAGLSEAEIDMDTDATEDEDDEEEAPAPMIVQAEVGAVGHDEDDGDETDGRPSTKGLVTGWSDGSDEESSFDADVFFANLSSDSDRDTSDDEAKESGGRLMEDDDETSSDVSTEAELMHMREELENLPLELAESWDGQLMFTNGTLGGQAIIDIDFEVNASQFVADTDTACCKNGQCGSPHHDHEMEHAGEDSDIEMSDVDDGGYEEDAGEGDGDTTDEELVGEDELPNERAMRLFNFPLSVSAINPLSTVSPAVTPGPKRPGPRMFNSSNRLDSPSPADILAGKIGWDSADEMDELFDSEQRGRRLIRGDGCTSEGDSIRLLGPRKGVFTPAQETRQVVIDDSHKEIPSPHPRFNRRRGRRFNTVSIGFFFWVPCFLKQRTMVEALLRKHLAAIARHPPSFVPAATVVPDSSPLKLLPSVEISASALNTSGLLTPGGQGHEGDHNLATPIDLDDVFESFFFNNPDASEASGSNSNAPSGGNGDSIGDAPPDSATTADESDSNRNERHLHRWDVISVGAFRQTRENVGAGGLLDSSPGPAGWAGDHHHHHRRTPASSADYGNVLKASPLSTMLWPSSDKGKKVARRNTLAGGATSALANSPLIMPRGDDGDRTPTKHMQLQQNHHQLNHQRHQQQQQEQQQQNYAPKTRKELRKERKEKKRKGYAHSPHGNHHPAHQYHSHHHHPNAKSRSSGSSQRTNFFLSSVPPLNI
ncbi:hypothetical protein D9611_006183 [Ephemerocybe angulata]|uniref:Uncharacterized protein n=1 Tax=Ephemerocybe angulata TaxID=980116 RepID=A0A8H5C6T1_9AGAR|nr:hypothetical protein D9611_006183 [Tulosesus angulatus]